MNKRNLLTSKFTSVFFLLLFATAFALSNGISVRAATENEEIVTKDGVTYLFVSEETFNEFYESSLSTSERNQIISVIRANNGAYILTDPYEGTSNAVTIENTINGKPVVLVGEKFFENGNVKSLSLPANIIYFYMNNSIESLTISPENNYYTVYEGVLYNKAKTEILNYIPAMMGSVYNVPNTITSIPYFPDTKVKTINIPASVTSLNDIFSSKSSLEAINVDKQNKKYSSEKGVLFDKKKTNLLYYPISKKDKKYTMPKTVKNVSPGAFTYQKYVQTLVMSDKITAIPPNSFYNMKNLKSVHFPNKLKSIGKYVKNVGLGYAFDHCPKLKSVTLPASCKTIIRAFEDCKALKTVKINAKTITFDADWGTIPYTIIIKKGAKMKVSYWNADKLTCKPKQILSVKKKDSTTFTVTAQKTGTATVTNEFKAKIKFKVVK